MNFINADELKTVMYEYQVNEITENDTTIILTAISAAIEEVKSYLRSKYDVKKIFSETGENRNALIVEICKDVAAWRLCRLSNVDMIYQHVKERYDVAINWLKDVANGNAAPDLPLITNNEGQPVIKIKFGSHQKFDSSY